ncbi:WecB/TagA/CpsF family glycosyltransferase [Amnibacterium endophyticum]|uniref:WecB/TagA/CpsF family glycosyltransferase n=1 Tax=Amnibacterium endophyticum TaxID=2109337 RepID=A0ABW4LBB1_9MICO
MTSHSHGFYARSSRSDRSGLRGSGRTAVPHPFDEASVAGVPVAVTTMDRAVEWLQDWTERRRGGIDVRLVNAYSVVAMHEDHDYLALARRSGVSFPDGAPVAAVLRLLRGRRDARRVRGPSFFTASFDRSAGTGVGEFLLGTTEDTLTGIERAAAVRWPELKIAGAWAPPFQEQVDADYVALCRDRIAASGADRVWIALGTPKQDRLAERLAQELQMPCIGVGAAFDFVAGNKREAPELLQRLGVEWLHRLLTEPRRLWRRYLLGNLQFLWLVVRHR